MNISTIRSTKRFQKRWTEEEDAQLLQLRSKFYPWVKIAKFNGRSADTCSLRYKTLIKGCHIKKPWTYEEDQLILSMTNEIENKQWTIISEKMNGRNAKQIKDRYIDIINPKTNKKNSQKKMKSSFWRVKRCMAINGRKLLVFLKV